MGSSETIIQKLESVVLDQVIRARTGKLTRLLERERGGFGLGQIPKDLKPDATTTLVCGFCSTGCGLRVHLKDGEAINLSPDTHYPVNTGMACPKGWESLAPLAASDRATTPLLRNASGELAEVSWETALSSFTKRFKAIQDEYGDESVAFLSTGQIATEEMALLGALAKFGMGWRHGDGNTRQCMATAAVAYKESFGFDAPPYTYQDFEESDVIVLVGSNLCAAHPIMWDRVMRNPHDPEIVVIDPRATETAMAATQHYALAPKSDLTLFYGLANLLIRNDWIAEEYIDGQTEGFDEFRDFVDPYTPEVVSEVTGIGVSDLDRLARTIAEGQRVSFWWTMGVNQSHEGVRVAQSIINLALMTGNIGRPGTGANSITGQCNAMGSRLYSNTTGLLGGRDFKSAEDRAEVAEILSIDESLIPDQDSLAYDQIIEGIRQGRIKGLWIIATNTAHSWINQNEVRETLGKLDFLVVQDLYYTTDSAKLADLVLPAGGWGEKDGTFINSERRIGAIKRVKRAPGVALADFHIFQLVAEAWGCGELFRDWSSPEAVFQILKRLSAGTPGDFSGIEDYRAIDGAGGIQWPCPAGGEFSDNQRRLFEDGRFFRENGRALFAFEESYDAAESTDADYPFVLLTGRGTSSEFHTQTRTGKSAVLRQLFPGEPFVEVNPHDARRIGIEPGMSVRVSSRRGEIEVRAVLTPVVQPGQLFIPMHSELTNQLTYPSFDKYSRQPSYKHCAVNLAVGRGAV